MARPDGGQGDGALAVQATRGAAKTLAWFAGTMLLGAFLVFSIQPLFARMALPLLGGAPAVWNTAMVFFQSALLAGYAYAHCLSRCLGPRAGRGPPEPAGARVAQPARGDRRRLGAASGRDVDPVADRPDGVDGGPAVSGGRRHRAADPTLVRGQRARGCGRPVFSVRGEQPRQRILALLSYPLLVEPTSRCSSRAGCGPQVTASALAITGCGLVVWRRASRASAPRPPGAPSAAQTIGWPRRLRWLVLALVPSSLLLAVTTHITTDLAAVPLLWVVPLALYLLTFVVAFARRPWLRQAWMVKGQPFVLIPLVLLFTWTPFLAGCRCTCSACSSARWSATASLRDCVRPRSA